MGAHHARGDDTVEIFGPYGGERDDVVQTDVSQRPEESIAMRRDSNVAWLARYSRALNMAGRAPEGGVVGSFDDHRRQADACDFDSADETVNRDGRRFVNQQALQITGLPLLKDPGVQQDEPAVSQRQGGAGEKETPDPLQSLFQRFSRNQNLHLAPAWLSGSGPPVAM